MNTIKYLAAIYLYLIPRSLGVLLWYTITLRPTEGMWEVGVSTLTMYYRYISVYTDGEVMYLYNSEKDLSRSMMDYIEDEDECRNETN